MSSSSPPAPLPSHPCQSDDSIVSPSALITTTPQESFFFSLSLQLPLFPTGTAKKKLACFLCVCVSVCHKSGNRARGRQYLGRRRRMGCGGVCHGRRVPRMRVMPFRSSSLAPPFPYSICSFLVSPLYPLLAPTLSFPLRRVPLLKPTGDYRPTLTLPFHPSSLSPLSLPKPSVVP